MQIRVPVSFAAIWLAASAFAENESVQFDKVYITGGQTEVLTKPGSATLIDDVALEEFEYTDIHRVLNAVPGVNLQEEDGYGLRPNIGLRGTSPERSKKVTIMEDGVLAGPAPYSAPAAYYFPSLSRMSAVEVFKGPSTIQYGPSTVGGAINMVSRPVPYSRQGELDVQYGSYQFQRINAYHGEQIGNFGYLIEGLNVQTDGFKDLDTGGDTGFDRNDISLKTNWQIPGIYSHTFQLKLGYADETSDETYLGLSKSDFNDDPYRRYAASQLDEAEWTHQQYQLTHMMETPDLILTTDVYHNTLDRDWFKLNGFNSSTVSLQNVLTNPSNFQSYYDVLRGEAASSTSQEQLRIGNNGREFISQGIQSRLNFDFGFAGMMHDLEIGLRYHHDEVDRNHTEQNYTMAVGGSLQAVSGTFKTTALSLTEADAVAFYVQDAMTIGNTTITAGLRHESIETTKTDYAPLTGVEAKKEKLTQSVFLPGLGIYSQLTEDLGVLAGVYKGFTAATPSGDENIEPEESINYELGMRYAGQLEFIAYANDYSQFSGTCSFSQGSCDTNNIGNQANAGSALVYGVETSWKSEFQLSRWFVPVSAVYTYSKGEFGEKFVDSSGVFGEEGLVIEDGFEIPYLPEHRLNLQAGVRQDQWQINVSALYQSEVRNVPGEGSIPQSDRVDAFTVLDLSASYQFIPNLQVYTTVDNLTDRQYAVAAKPYGFRPGKPRTVHLGVKYQF